MVRNIELRNVSSRKSKYALYLRACPSAPIRDIRLDHCTFDNVADLIENVQGLKLNAVTVTGRPAGPG